MENTNTNWSDNAINQTVKALMDVEVYPLGEKLCFKNSDGSFGYIYSPNILENKYALFTHENKLINTFYTIQSLVDADWVID